MPRSLQFWFARTFDTWRAPLLASQARWERDGGEAFRDDFSGIGADDVAIDFGGTDSGWPARIHAETGCVVFVYAPDPAAAAAMRARSGANPAIRIHDHGVGERARPRGVEDGRTVPEQRSAADVLAEWPDGDIALVRIDLGGDEYDLLPALATAGAMARIRMLQMRFALTARRDLARRSAAMAALEATHAADWCYPFVWEQWTRSRNA